MEPDAKVEEIKKAYKKRATEYHPDKVANLGQKLKIVAEMESKRLNKAKEVLLDKVKRREYDEILKKRGERGIRRSDRVDDEGLEKFETRTEVEYQNEVAALQAMISSLNYEISVLREKFNKDRNYRRTLEKNLELLSGDRFWMKRDLEFLINKYDEQVKFIDDQYRRLLHQIINDLYIEFQLSDEENVDIQRRIVEIQGITYQSLEALRSRFDNFSTIRRNLDNLKRRGEVAPPVVSDSSAVTVESPEVEEEVKADVDWDYDPSPRQPKKPKVKLEKVEREEPAGRKPVLNDCPYCGKEVEREQTYCYYCGTVFWWD